MTDFAGCSDCGGAPADGVAEFDARQVPPLVRPGAIFGAVGSLPAGAPLILVAPHDPAGLLSQLQGRYPDLTVSYVSDVPGECKVRLLRG